MTVEIEPVWREIARLWSDMILATDLTATPNYTELERDDRFYIGYIGELCLRSLLLAEGKRVRYTVRLDGRADTSGSDFTVIAARDGARRKLNVKTASQPHYQKLMIPESQFRKYHSTAYVGARLVGEVCHFEGWIYHAELSARSPERVHVLTRSCPFIELRPMETLIEKLA
jgi:hypothetical protein